MSFNAGELVAKIRLDGKAQFDRDVDGSGQKFTAAQKLADAAGKGIASAFTTASVGIGVASVASTAYIASLFKTGVAYNTLQQTSRAALNTLLGGATAANAQMDKLDAFARNSPFSKSVFISAQQQLIGFGMEASKVIPTLNAVQNAVAAVGGSNQDIAGIVEIIAKIGSSSKITAEDLNQLGGYGLDAATLIGTSMGKSGAEIRASITAGTLGAGEAVDALVASMDSKFSGAAANVKNTFSGTVDRIKAASRDIGAALAEPFVSKNGGGLFVTWGNQVADVMRAVEKHVTPVVSILTGRALPAFAGITQELDKAKISVASWDSSSLSTFLDQASAYGPILAGVAGGVAAVNSGLLSQIPIIGSLFPKVNPLVGALVGVAVSSSEVRSAAAGMVQALQPIIPIAQQVARVVAGGLNAALPAAAGGIRLVSDVAGPLLQILAQIPAPVLAGGAAMLAFGAATKKLGEDNGVLNTALQAGVKEATAFGSTWQTARVFAVGASGDIEAMSGRTAALSSVMGRAKGAVAGFGNSLKAAFISNPVGIALLVITGAVGLLTAALGANAEKAQKASDAAASLRSTLNQTTGEVTAATAAQVRLNLENDRGRELAKKLGVSFEDVVGAANGNADAFDRVKLAANGWNAGTSASVKNLSPLQAAMEGTANAGNDLVGSIEAQINAQDLAREALRGQIRAQREAMASLDDVGRANARFGDAMKIVSDESRSAEERVNALRQALDLLKGGSVSAEQAQINLSKATLDLKDTLAQAAEDGTPLWQSFLDGAGNIDLSTRAGISFAEQLASSRTKMLDAATAASDFAKANDNAAGAQDAAKAAAQDYIDSLRETMKAAGIAEPAIDALISKYLDVPATVATLVTDDGTITGTQAKLIDLANQVLATPDKTITVTEPMSPAIIQNLKNLGFTVDTLPDGSVQVTASGIDEIRKNLDALTVTRYAQIVVETLSGAADAIKKNANADGGLYAGAQKVFANGGLENYVQAFASGGFPSGIYKGRPGGIHKFAEPEVGWEAYVSGKPGMEARNRLILTDAAKRLGMEVVPTGAQRATAAPSVAGSAPVSFATQQGSTGSQITIKVDVHGAPGMTEEHLGDIVAAKVARALR